jgi:hypothetical protein
MQRLARLRLRSRLARQKCSWTERCPHSSDTSLPAQLTQPRSGAGPPIPPSAQQATDRHAALACSVLHPSATWPSRAWRRRSFVACVCVCGGGGVCAWQSPARQQRLRLVTRDSMPARPSPGLAACSCSSFGGFFPQNCATASPWVTAQLKSWSERRLRRRRHSSSWRQAQSLEPWPWYLRARLPPVLVAIYGALGCGGSAVQ